MGFTFAHLNILAISLIVPIYFLYVFTLACFSKKNPKRKLTVGLFHPYCNAGGGGERVLWVALRSLQHEYPECQYVVYTGDVGVSKEDMIKNAKSGFNITLNPDNLEFVYLKKRGWVEANRYPSFTLLGQSIGSILLGLEAMAANNPDIFIDTMGYAFTLPFFKFLGGAAVGCYVHYPTISTDMLKNISDGKSSHNNQEFVAKSSLLSNIKLWYYKAFAKLYSSMGRASDVVMVNSSWTENHINHLWKMSSSTFKVYPPCDVKDFKKIPQPEDDSEKVAVRIVSVAQFRPEKDHALQLHSLAKLKPLVSKDAWRKIKLVLIGSVRNEDDERRVQALRNLTEELDLNSNVEFRINVSFEELKEQLSSGLIGIHTMWNEHFGIGIVECMAAGLIMVAHKSGGPLKDIVVEDETKRNGYLAASEDEYATAIKSILDLTPSKRAIIRLRARVSVDRFSEEKFSEGFLSAVAHMFR